MKPTAIVPADGRRLLRRPRIGYMMPAHGSSNGALKQGHGSPAHARIPDEVAARSNMGS